MPLIYAQTRFTKMFFLVMLPCIDKIWLWVNYDYFHCISFCFFCYYLLVFGQKFWLILGCLCYSHMEIITWYYPCTLPINITMDIIRIVHNYNNNKCFIYYKQDHSFEIILKPNASHLHIIMFVHCCFVVDGFQITMTLKGKYGGDGL